MCFNLTTQLRSFAAASAACRTMSGQLVQYNSAAKQLLVEMVRIMRGSWEWGHACCASSADDD
jgi:hypothetical protein